MAAATIVVATELLLTGVLPGRLVKELLAVAMTRTNRPDAAAGTTRVAEFSPGISEHVPGTLVTAVRIAVGQ
jgi:hypothetical protein